MEPERYFLSQCEGFLSILYIITFFPTNNIQLWHTSQENEKNKYDQHDKYMHIVILERG